MSSLSDRLRGVLGSPRIPASTLVQPLAGGRSADDGSPAHADSAAEILGGQWHECDGHRFMVVERTYSPGHRHGRAVVADYLPAADGRWPRLPLLLTDPGEGLAGRADPSGGAGTRVLFLDLETTGLAGGAGTYAFLVGCAWFDGAVFRVRQLFLASYAAERLLLEAVAGLARETAMVVTYNGKSFDLPLIETRFLLHRMDHPFAGISHLDMVHPARRLWRADGEETPDTPASGCRLTAVEHSLWGRTRDGDVPGFEIPSRYFHYVRTGDARPLNAVFEHNRLDLLALALVTGYAAQLLEEGPSAARTAREALGLGALYERARATEAAKASFARAVELDETGHTRAEALRAYALLCRRERAYEEAAAAWRQLLESCPCSPGLAREATEALAVHHEHRLRDPRAARQFALRSLGTIPSPSRTRALHHRLARLERKLGDAMTPGLFLPNT